MVPIVLHCPVKGCLTNWFSFHPVNQTHEFNCALE